MTDIRVEEIGNQRFYCFPDGRRYPSVTTILQVVRKPFLETWRGEKGNQEADRIRDRAADIGTMVHGLCEFTNKGFSPELPWGLPVAPMVRAYQDWFNQYIDKVLFTELTVWSNAYRYAGKVDLVAVYKGDTKPTVFDIKTSNQLDATFPMQLAGYHHAFRENIGSIADIELPLRRLVIRLDKREPGVLEVKEYHNHGEDFAAFLNCVGLWRYLNK